jgi:hypothetical protein
MNSALLFDLFLTSHADFANGTVWAAAAKCALSGALLLSGVMISLASFQGAAPHRGQCQEASILVLTIILGQLASYLFVFGLLEQNDRLQDFTVLLDSGGFDATDLAFGVMPELLSELHRIWIVLFFVMLFFFQLGATTVLVESVLSSLEDLFVGAKRFRTVSAALLVAAVFGLSLLAWHQGTIVYFQALEPRFAGIITVSWVTSITVFTSDKQ